MLTASEAQRVAHGRLVRLVKAAQEACGALNPEPTSTDSNPRNETQFYMEELGAAWDQARDGLSMLREAENAPQVGTLTVNYDGGKSSGWSH